jgi:putative ABC transport system substrate-binding protein
MEHPGRNLTGIAGFQDGIAADWVAILREIAPQVARIGVFSNPASVSKAALAGWKTVAAKSAEIYDVFVDAVSDIAPSIAAVARDAHAGLIVVPHTFPFANRKRVVEAMAQYRVPAVYGIAEMVRAGGLVSYGQDLRAQWRMAASYVDKIFKGARASDLPARYANKYALAINTRAAAAMGLETPARLLARADEVVN